MATFTTDRGNRKRKMEIAAGSGICQFCPIHGGENASRKPKHGTQKSRKRLRRGK